MGFGVAVNGALKRRATTLKVGGYLEGDVLVRLLNSDVVDERTPGGRGKTDVLVALGSEATADRWGMLQVGRARIALAPLSFDQQQDRLNRNGPRGVDDRPLKSLIELRSQRAGIWTWEFRNVLIEDFEFDSKSTGVVSFSGTGPTK